MTKKQLGPVLVLLLCGAAILYLLVRSLSPGETSPIWYLMAVPAIIAARLAWKRMQRP